MSEKRLKMAVIAGASKALAEKEKNRNKSDTDIIQEISSDMDEIIAKIDSSS